MNSRKRGQPKAVGPQVLWPTTGVAQMAVEIDVERPAVGAELHAIRAARNIAERLIAKWSEECEHRPLTVGDVIAHDRCPCFMRAAMSAGQIVQIPFVRR